jgi:hypothetical protein
MNRAKDGNVFRHASPARMRRPGGLFLSRTDPGVLGALGLLRFWAARRAPVAMKATARPSRKRPPP